jgi:hypothetical protein
LPYTTFFFSINFTFVSTGTFLWVYEKNPTVYKLINEFFPEKEASSIKSNEDYKYQEGPREGETMQINDLIETQKKDEAFVLSRDEIMNVISV